MAKSHGQRPTPPISKDAQRALRVDARTSPDRLYEQRHLVAVRLPPELYELMHADAENNHRSDGAQAVYIIQQYYAQKEMIP